MKLRNKDLLDIDSLSPEEIELFLSTAVSFKEVGAFVQAVRRARRHNAVVVNPPTQELSMNDQTNDRCACPNCPTDGCQCGCQTAAPTAQISYAGLHCQCGPACGCDAAEQGCLCRQ